VRNVIGRAVEIDEIVTMKAGVRYGLRWTKVPATATQAGVTAIREVEPIVGETKIVALRGQGELPEIGDLAIFGPLAEESREVVVTRIDRDESMNARITMQDHAPEIEALVDAEVPPVWDGRVGFVIDYSASVPQIPVFAQIISGADAESSPEDPVRVKVTMAPGVPALGPVSRYDVQHRLQGETEWVDDTANPVVFFSEYDPGQVVEIRARAVGFAGLASGWTPSQLHTVSNASLVFRVEQFAALRSGGLWRFTWTLSGQDDDYIGVRIRSLAGAWGAWTDLTPLHGGLLTVSPWETTEPSANGLYTFGIVGVTVDNIETPPMLIYAISPDETLTLLVDDSGALLTDDNGTYLIED
jgi:hypothetical protein